MRWIVIYQNQAFLTDWYSYENVYQEGMTVINTATRSITFNGLDWFEITEDHL